MEHLRKYLIASTLFLFLMAPVQILVQLTTLTSIVPLAVYSGIIILLGLWVKDKFVRYFGQLMAFIVLNYILFIPVFQQGLQPLQSIRFLLSQQEGQLLIIATAIFICMVNLAFDYAHWKISFIIIFFFLILSQVMKQTVIFKELIVFLLASLVLAFLLEQRNLLKHQERVKLTGLVFFLLAISLVSGLAFPQQLSQPLSQATAYVQQELGQTNFYQLFNQGKPQNKTGYDDNDSELGGPLEQDDTPVFKATFHQGKPETAFYWRIEAKDVYTGKGWQASSDQGNKENLGSWFNQTTPYLSPEAHKITIQTQKSSSYFVLPYGENHFSLSNHQGNETIVEQKSTGKVMPHASWNVQEYTLINKEPAYTIEQLQHADFSQRASGINRIYTQLPESVPQRVYELAQTLTMGRTTTYDQVAAIEEYLKNSGTYSYSQQKAKQTPKNQDYVDYFLFDEKIGYCDNFASSMVVLSRTLGIPARWVKGFTLGNLVESNEASVSYQVTNAEAHSWVEIYFPEIGWVPFDPTTGFGLAQTDSQIENQESNEEGETAKDSTSGNLENNLYQDQNATSLFSKNQLILLVIAFFVLIGGLCYGFRLKLRINKLNRYLKKEQAEFGRSFAQLLLIFEAYQKKAAGKTIRDYGKHFIELEPQLSEPLLFLLNRYEAIEFGQAQNERMQPVDRAAFKKIIAVLQESKRLRQNNVK
ncbi:transglutaminase family protein [Isobaculum melis]|uniref:Transglutaminase-like enzyme, putative cysteine protease n=1 Tax=Isobaculum melis TaxID=142588 RepID=A0A1H9QIS8_9LACT|nr:transglutaminase domain-containing protein [Isobaculum melis]SER60340.1 Transglutaminase-like enzyme, putative cysteine protease [Isobaculum melis]